MPVLQTSAGRAQIVSGTYEGNGTSKDVTLSFSPKAIEIFKEGSQFTYFGGTNGGVWESFGEGMNTTSTMCVLGTGKFSVSYDNQGGSLSNTINDNGATYLYTAWG